jgi:NTP pyrophosphatase (non-canonical NTP hydrolase)
LYFKNKHPYGNLPIAYNCIHLYVIFNYTMDITLKQAQSAVDHWIKTFGVRYFNELTNTAILMEEVGEVARIMARKYGEQSFKKSDTEVDLADEMADVLFVLICLANQTGIDLNDALQKNLDKKTKRDANRHNQNPKL